MGSEPEETPGREGRRERVIAELIDAEREMSTVAVMFHSLIAAKRGLNATETKALDWLQREGPLTAKELVQRSGLAPASVTGLVDRLERKGYVRRVPHPTDQRRVLVEMRPEGRRDLEPLFVDFLAEIEQLHEGFSTEELELIGRYVTEATRRQRRAAARFAGRDPDAPESGTD